MRPSREARPMAVSRIICCLYLSTSFRYRCISSLSPFLSNGLGHCAEGTILAVTRIFYATLGRRLIPFTSFLFEEYIVTTQWTTGLAFSSRNSLSLGVSLGSYYPFFRWPLKTETDLWFAMPTGWVVDVCNIMFLVWLRVR